MKRLIDATPTDYIRIAAMCILIITGSTTASYAQSSGHLSFEPWDEKGLKSKMASPNVKSQKKNSLIGQDGNILKMALSLGVKFFQRFISPVDGDRCAMYPTCSTYSLLALKKHGGFIGLIMTADRLIHEVDEQKFAPIIKKYRTPRYLDPVEANDFWWYKNN